MLKFQLLTPSGLAFIQPLIVVTDGKKSKTLLPSDVTLQFGYVAMATVNGDVTAFKDKTKFEAGCKVIDSLKKLPASASMNVYLPIDYNDRGSNDLNKWANVVSVNVADMVKACEVLVKTSAIITKAEADVNTLANGASLKAYPVVTLPVYAEAGTKGKRAGGQKDYNIDL